MRVISGEYRSRLLIAPRGLDVRPTSDRLRETLFNVLAQRVAGAVFLDLYAGSGAVGIEALSRGAAETVFVENSEASLRAIRGNLASLRIQSKYALEPRSVVAALRGLTERNRQAGIVFLDPPYAAEEQYSLTLELLGGECRAVLAENAIIVAEHEKRRELKERYGTLGRIRVLKQGDSALSFYSAQEEE